MDRAPERNIQRDGELAASSVTAKVPNIPERNVPVGVENVKDCKIVSQ